MVLLNSDAPAVYLGATAATRVYLGTTQVWQPGGGEPAGFPDTVTVLARWKADDITGADGDLVSSWPAITGGQALTSSGTARPTLQTAELNGKSVMRFDGTDDVLTATGLTSIAQPMTPYVVLKVNTATIGQEQIVIQGGTSGDLRAEMNLKEGYRRIWAGDRFNWFQQVAGNTWHVWSVGFNGTTPSYVNGVDEGGEGNLNAGTLGFGTTVRVGMHHTDGRPFAGDIAEIVICSGVHSSGQRSAMQAYFHTEYAV